MPSAFTSTVSSRSVTVCPPVSRITTSKGKSYVPLWPETRFAMTGFGFTPTSSEPRPGEVGVSFSPEQPLNVSARASAMGMRFRMRRLCCMRCSHCSELGFSGGPRGELHELRDLHDWLTDLQRARHDMLRAVA